MNRIKKKLQEDQKILSIYFTAGFPSLNDTVPIIKQLENSGVDMIEIGLPFSDPLADGPTIQKSSQVALENGFSTEILFEQLIGIRENVEIPLILMGYFNPILQFGVERFCQGCQKAGIDGLIIPDLPVEEYERHYRTIFKKFGMLPIFLVTPQTSDERIRLIDSISEAFIYLVSSSGVTGSTSGFGNEQSNYFRRISQMKLSTPLIVGFGVKDADTFRAATENAKGAIIGSAFIKHLEDKGTKEISGFISSIK